MTAAACEERVHGIVDALKGHLLSVYRNEHGQHRGVRVLAGALQWIQGNRRVPPPDPIRTPSLHLRKDAENLQAGNPYFIALYQNRGRHLRGMQAAEHTGRISLENCIERERRFRDGDLPSLFCSPTMELGVDIRDLHMVHMPNVPPTPANYAQRSGRAGRGGQSALIVAFAAQGNAHDQYFFGCLKDMIAGAVTPARLDLQNEPLVTAHLHSTWLALGHGIADILDLDIPEFPLRPELGAQLAGRNGERIYEEAFGRCCRIASRTRSHTGTPVFDLDLVEEILRQAPRRFDAAFDHWRELRAARRELELLLNQTRSPEESDFYPYRYLVMAGFLPGYNFPCLPVRTSVATRDKAQVIDRPRCIGLTEFGLGNRVYHEGRKHRIDSLVLPPGGIDEAFRRARLCNVCGYLHEQEHTEKEVCRFYASPLDPAYADYPQRLLDQPMMRSRPVERISSEEEERVRRGYATTTHFSLERNADSRFNVQDPQGQPLMEALFVPMGPACGRSTTVGGEQA